MNTNKWMQERARIKRETGNVITNFTTSSVPEDVCEKVYRAETYYATLYWNIDKYVLEFVVATKDDLRTLIELIPNNTIINIVYKDKCDLDDFFASEGLSLYASYQRNVTRYKSNPYLLPEVSKRRQILPKMYDPACGEYPDSKDAEELDQLHRQVFDPLCDDMFTIDEWKEKINNKEILVYRERGKITAYYCFRLEGQKLYSNMSVNIGAANTLYNMERRIFEEMWNKGIRVFYGWFNLKNVKAKNHGIAPQAANRCVESSSRSFCNTYLKGGE